MRDARSEGRIKSIHIERDVDRRIEIEAEIIAPIFHLDDFNAEPCDLLPLMSGHRADADLDEPRDQSLFHNARERASVRITIALEFVIDIWMSVEVKNGQLRIFLAESSDDWISNCVISAQR